MPPLNEWIDLDALNALLGHGQGSSDNTEEIGAEVETVEEVFHTLMVELPNERAVQEVRRVRGEH